MKEVSQLLYSRHRFADRYLFLNKNLKRKIYYFIPALAWWILTFVLLVLPGSDIPQSSFFDVLYFDKWVHIGMFGMLTFLWCLPFFKTRMASLRLFAQIALCSIAYGVLMEYVQKYLTADREFDVLDIAADSVGSILSLFWLSYLLRRKQA
jgi:VanZ family protein